MRFRLILACSSVLLAHSLSGWSADAPTGTRADEYSAQLERLRTKIQSLQTAMERDRSERDAVQAALTRIERQIGTINQTLLTTREDITTKNRRIEWLSGDYRRNLEHLNAQLENFYRLVYATYVMGRQGYVKMLLNQENPARLGRAITYYRYFARARAQQISDLNETLATLERLKGRLAEEKTALHELEQTQLENRRALEDRRRERALLVAKLNERITNQGQELETLRRNERRLVRLLQELADLLRDIPADLAKGGTPFSGMRGRLFLPLRAEIAARFDQPKMGNIRWKGLLINGREDESVNAIYHGRVVFADWLRGFGLLLIIDHGEGYMSLYANNKILYKQVGDWVETGTPIAAVGTSGGLDQAGLYFEIRHNGHPQNPLVWCRAN